MRISGWSSDVCSSDLLGAPAGADAIVIAGTRITSGFTAPTPVTVQTADELLTSAPGTLADGLNQLPQFRGSDVPQAGGVSANGAAGANLLNLRNLGAERNLVLDRKSTRLNSSH